MNEAPASMMEVAALAKRRRKMKEAGIALVFASVVLLGMAYMGHRVTKEEMLEQEVPVAVSSSRAFADIALRAKAAIVYDLTTGETLYEHNADAQLPLASLTKLLTVYAGQSVLSENSLVPITDTALSAEGDNGFSVGDTFTFKDAAALALVASSNDAASAIEEAARTRKSNEDFLLAAAASAGLSQTYAVNGTGLDENEEVSGGYGSARDVALLSGALLAVAPDIARLSTKSSISVATTNGKTITVENTNEDMVRLPNVLLSKTGFTDLAGGNLVIVFDAGIGHPIAVAVLGSTREGRFTDVARLTAATLRSFAPASLPVPLEADAR